MYDIMSGLVVSVHDLYSIETQEVVVRRYSSKQVSVTLYVRTLQNDQMHSNNSSAVADELFECVRPFCKVRA